MPMEMEYRRTEDGILGKAPKPCILCSFNTEDDLNYGKFYVLSGEIFVHYYCVLFSCNLPQNGQDSEGVLGFLEKDIMKEAKRGQKIKCCYCHRYSCTIGCSVKTCKRQFHRICGLENGSLYQFNDTFKTYCAEHKPRQVQEIEHLSAKRTIESSSLSESCPICFNVFAPREDIVWVPCCQKEAKFHKHCLQLTALSFGYFFKCPLCNEKDKFREVMQNFGIFIPNQDAAWEIEGRFLDLEREAKKCGEPECLCPKGRNFHCQRYWYIKTCDYCGSESAHVKCAGVSNSHSNWYCKTCKVIKRKRSQEKSTLKRVTLGEHSLSIAVPSLSERNGEHLASSSVEKYDLALKENHLPDEAAKKLGPAPLSIKLKRWKMEQSKFNEVPESPESLVMKFITAKRGCEQKNDENKNDSEKRPRKSQ